MITRRDILGNMMGGAVTAGLVASPLAAAVQFDQRKRGFDITRDDGGVVSVFVDADDVPDVRRATADLAPDISRVTGTAAEVVGDRVRLPARIILVGSIGHSPLIERMIASGKLDVSGIRDKWESFVVETIADPLPGVAEALVIVGSDKRGAICGAYDLSRMIGVSPWYWWADVPVVRQTHLRVAHGRYVQQSPAVKHRGIFLNDEAPCQSDCPTENFGAINAQRDALEKRMLAVGAALRPDQRDAYYQLVEFPVAAVANLYRLHYGTAWNRLLASINDARANYFADQVETAFRRDGELTRRYHKINGGKWA